MRPSDLVELDVRKPARYLGPEYFPTGYRPPGSGDFKVLLAYPDLYEIGMSNTGLRILYSLLRRMPGIYVDLAFAPWADMEEALRRTGESLRSRHADLPLASFDLVGFSLQYELNYTNVLTMLDLAGIPLRAAQRAASDTDPTVGSGRFPLVIGGGPCASHAEPMAPFFDCFAVGDGEEALPRMVELVRANAGRPRDQVLPLIDAMPGAYVPALREPELEVGGWASGKDNCGGRRAHDADSDADPEPRGGQPTVQSEADRMSRPDQIVGAGRPLRDGARPRLVHKQSVADLDAYLPFVEFPVPAIESVFDRVSLEIARGCQQGCRFCEAGFTYRPPRERDPAAMEAWARQTIAATGLDEISIACLSTADYSQLLPLVDRLRTVAADLDVSLAISSLRAYGLDPTVLRTLNRGRISSLTLAPEAGSQRLRNLINKNVTRPQILEAMARVADSGIKRVKLYFMVGLPTETLRDMEELRDLVVDCGRIVRSRFSGRGALAVSISWFVPRPHTPFQWEGMLPLPQIEQRLEWLRSNLPRGGVELKWHNPRMSWLEAVLTRGDSRLADAIESAWREGARFDSWDEVFRVDFWRRAFEAHDIDPAAYLGPVEPDQPLPWDHVKIAVDDSWLERERKRALEEATTPPCDPFGEKFVCFRCGAGCVGSAEARSPLPASPDGGGGCEGGTSAMGTAAAPLGGGARGLAPSGGGTAPPISPPRRLRITYRKEGPAILLGHLDLLRQFTLLVRRAGLRFARSQGYNPRPLLYFPPPLPLGWPGFEEVVDVMVQDPGTDEDLLRRLADIGIPGLPLMSATLPDETVPKASKLDVADYLVQLGTVATDDSKGADPLVLIRAAVSSNGLPALLVEAPTRSDLPLPTDWPETGTLLRIRWPLSSTQRIDRKLAEVLPNLKFEAVARERLCTT